MSAPTNSPSSDPGESPFAYQPQGIPLAGLFLLVAIAAVLLGMLTVALRTLTLREGAGFERLIAAVVSSLVIGGIGAFRGIFSFERLLQVSLGIVCGGLVGLLAAAILFTAPKDVRELISLALFGSLLIVALAAGIRWQSRG